MGSGSTAIVSACVAAIAIGAQDEPMDVDLLRRLGAVHVRQEAYGSAGACFDRVVASPEAAAQDWVNRGAAECLEHSSVLAADLELALACFRKAQSLDPTLADGWSGEAWVLDLRDDDTHEAQETLLWCANLLDPAFAIVPFRLALLAYERDEEERAIALFDAARSRAAERGSALEAPATYRLAQMLRRRNRDGDQDRAMRLLNLHMELLQVREHRALPQEQMFAGARIVVPDRPAAIRVAAGPAQGLCWESGPSPLVRAVAPVRWLDVADMDGDGLDDVVVTDAAGVLLLRKESNSAFGSSRVIAGTFERAIAVDFERLGDTSLLVQSEDRLQVFDPRPWGLFELETSFPAGEEVRDFAAIDWDGDRDLDLWVATGSGVRWWRNDGFAFLVEDGEAFKSGPLTFVDASAEAGGAPDGVGIDWLVIEDFDGDRLPDLLCGGREAPISLLTRDRIGRPGAPRAAPPTPLHAPGDEPIALDLDGDGCADLLSTADLAMRRALLEDVDLDGELDLVGLDRDGRLIARLGPLRDPARPSIELGVDPGTAPFLVADLDRDADLDVVTSRDGGILLHRCTPDPRRRGLHLRLEDRFHNPGSVGVVVEWEVEGRVARRWCAGDRVVLGLGTRELPDLVTLHWPKRSFDAFLDQEFVGVGPIGVPMTGPTFDLRELLREQPGESRSPDAAGPAIVIEQRERYASGPSTPFPWRRKWRR